MIPKSWFDQKFEDIALARRRIHQLLMIVRELDAKCNRWQWEYERAVEILHERTGLSYEEIDDLVWERTEES